ITATVYLNYLNNNYFMTLVPGVILFVIDMMYLFTDEGIGFGMQSRSEAALLSLIFSIVVTTLILFFAKGFRTEKTNNSDDDYELEA
ncbi:MAG: hypothetical protein ACK5LC_10835, partial [Coprobacillaceae bacterium]